MPDAATPRQRISRDASQRMAEVHAGLLVLIQELDDRDAGYDQVGRLAGSLAWRLLVVREMAFASMRDARTVGMHTAALSAVLDRAMTAARYDGCRELHEALADLQTVLADIDDAAALADAAALTVNEGSIEGLGAARGA